MRNIKLVFAIIVAVIAMLVVTETAEAQMRRRGRVVRRPVRVVTVRHRVVVRRAHVRYAHLPRWGAPVAVVPAAAVVVRASNNVYHYHNGIFYAPRNNGFVVVRPIVGMRVRVLPVGYRTVVVSNRNYYYYYGSFYSRPATTNEYEVVDAPVGAIVDALPDGYEVKKIGDTEYYVLDGVYYAEVETSEFEDGIGYQVVKV
jgi:hypothetical protein